jgi:muramoyltetrapeptide carboxypeptidase
MKIGVISPSAPSTHNEKSKAQFEKGLEVIKSLGFECVLGDHAANALSYVSDTVENRLADLHAMYKDQSVGAIVAANGGWNASHLLGKLDVELIKSNPKPLIGFSDISVLLNPIYKLTGQKCAHGPMVTWGFSENNELTNKSFMQYLKAETQEYSLKEFGTYVKGDRIEGEIIAGNLATMETLLGTLYEPDWESKIFCFEETEETLYRLDRVLTHFKNAGVWSKVAGVVIGHLDQIDEKFEEGKTDTMVMIREHFAEYNFPILKTDLFGHNIPSNISLPIGGRMVGEGDTVRLIP